MRMCMGVAVLVLKYCVLSSFENLLRCFVFLLSCALLLIVVLYVGLLSVIEEIRSQKHMFLESTLMFVLRGYQQNIFPYLHLMLL